MSRSNSFKSVAATALTVVTLLAASGAQATLSYRLNNQAVYDSEANLTWLRDANANGFTNWAPAMAWAGSLNIDGVTGWRLPGGTMGFGYDQTASEMGNMFYNVLGGTAHSSIIDNHNSNYAFFQNVKSRGYWSGFLNPTTTFDNPWFFGFGDGIQSYIGFYNSFAAWAVQTGDVEASAVPAPGTLALLGAGLLGWVGVKRSGRRA